MRPTYDGEGPDLDGVDTVYVGFPIWWYDAPRIIDTFMDEPSLRGRKVVVFATSGGTQIDGAYAKLSARHPELNVVKGRLLRGTDAVDWAEELRNG